MIPYYHASPAQRDSHQTLWFPFTRFRLLMNKSRHLVTFLGLTVACFDHARILTRHTQAKMSWPSSTTPHGHSANKERKERKARNNA